MVIYQDLKSFSKTSLKRLNPEKIENGKAVTKFIFYRKIKDTNLKIVLQLKKNQVVSSIHGLVSYDPPLKTAEGLSAHRYTQYFPSIQSFISFINYASKTDYRGKHEEDQE